MKNNTVRKIFSIITMLVLLIALFPLQETSAATKFLLKSGAAAPATIYTGHKYDLKVKGVTSGDLRFRSKDKTVATISAQGGTLTAKAPGTAKIEAYNKKTNKTYCSISFKVLQRAKSITPSETEVNVPINGTYDLTVVKNPETSTDELRFISTDKTIATVGAKSGKITGKSEGSTTVTIVSKASSTTSNSSKYNKTATVTVNVGTCFRDVFQLSDYEAGFTVLGLTDDCKNPENYSLSVEAPVDDENTNPDVTVSEAKIIPVISADYSIRDNTIRITAAEKIDRASRCTVFYKNKATDAVFTATDGIPAAITFEPERIEIGEPAPIYVVIKDSNNVTLEKIALTDKASLSKKKIKYSIEKNDQCTLKDGYCTLNTDSSSIVLSAVMTMGTSKNKKTIAVNDFIISAFTAEDRLYSFAYEQFPGFSPDELKYRDALNIYKDCEDQNYVVMKITETNEQPAPEAAYDGYTLTSSKPELVKTDGVFRKINGVYCCQLHPQKASGKCYLTVKDVHGNIAANVYCKIVGGDRRIITVTTPEGNLDKYYFSAGQNVEEFLNRNNPALTQNNEDSIVWTFTNTLTGENLGKISQLPACPVTAKAEYITTTDEIYDGKTYTLEFRIYDKELLSTDVVSGSQVPVPHAFEEAGCILSGKTNISHPTHDDLESKTMEYINECFDNWTWVWYKTSDDRKIPEPEYMPNYNIYAKPLIPNCYYSLCYIKDGKDDNGLLKRGLSNSLEGTPGSDFTIDKLIQDDQITELNPKDNYTIKWLVFRYPDEYIGDRETKYIGQLKKIPEYGVYKITGLQIPSDSNHYAVYYLNYNGEPIATADVNAGDYIPIPYTEHEDWNKSIKSSFKYDTHPNNNPELFSNSSRFENTDGWTWYNAYGKEIDEPEKMPEVSLIAIRKLKGVDEN